MEYRPNQARAKTAIILIVVVLAIEILSLVSDYLQYDLLLGVQSGEFLDDGTAEANDLRQQIIGVLYLAAFFVSAVTFIRWFRRAYFNLQNKMRPGLLKYDDGGAAAFWFIPVFCLFRPLQIMREMFRMTEIYLAENSKGHIPAKTYVLGWWWTFWILNTIFGQITFRTFMGAETIEDFIFSTQMSMVSETIGIPLALLAILVIQEYSEKERLLEKLSTEAKNETAPEAGTPDLLPES